MNSVLSCYDIQFETLTERLRTTKDLKVIQDVFQEYDAVPAKTKKKFPTENRALSQAIERARKFAFDKITQILSYLDESIPPKIFVDLTESIDKIKMLQRVNDLFTTTQTTRLSQINEKVSTYDVKVSACKKELAELQIQVKKKGSVPNSVIAHVRDLWEVRQYLTETPHYDVIFQLKEKIEDYIQKNLHQRDEAIENLTIENMPATLQYLKDLTELLQAAQGILNDDCLETVRDIVDTMKQWAEKIRERCIVTKDDIEREMGQAARKDEETRD